MIFFRYGRRPDETAEEMSLRLYATELHEWNHRHWQKQNFSYSSIKQQLLDEVQLCICINFLTLQLQ